MFGKKRREKKDFNLTYDNLAIPEVHTRQDETTTTGSSITPADNSDDTAVTDDVFMDCDESKEHEVSYEGVAIPEVHIGKRRR